MGFNYGLEKNKFLKKWALLREEYRAAGMSEAATQAMRDHDWAEFKSERIFRMHTQPIDGANSGKPAGRTKFANDGATDEGWSPLLKNRPEQFCVRQPEISKWGRYDWIEDIDNPDMAGYLKSLPQDSIEILTCLVMDGMSRAEISRKLNVSRAAITKRTNPTKKIMEKIYAEWLTKQRSR